jgi:hypothetical protein
MSYVSFPGPQRRRRGMGALSPQDQILAQSTAQAAALIGWVGGPVGYAIAQAAAQIGVLLANVFSGCGDTCVEATNIANQAEPLLLKNLQTYLSAPVHYASLQAAFLNNFDMTWNALKQACSNPSLGAAGQSCISDRQEGSCAYKTSPGGWANGVYTYPGANGSGSTCWNWFVGYRDPIANDPTVVPDPVGGSAAVSATNLLSSVGVPATVFGLPVLDLILIGAGLLVASELL